MGSAVVAVAGSAVVAAALVSRRRTQAAVLPVLETKLAPAGRVLAPEPEPEEALEPSVEPELTAAQPEAAQPEPLAPPPPPPPISAPVRALVETLYAGNSEPTERPTSSRRRPVALGLAIAAVAVLAVVAVVSLGGGDDAPETANLPLTTQSTLPPTTTVDQWTADEAFALSGVRLESAGSFAYSGLSSATDVSPVRPGPWLTVELTVAGEIDLRNNQLHELALATEGTRASETVTDGMTVWGKSGPSQASLASRSFETVEQLDPTAPVRLGAGLLPLWLGATTARQEIAPDDQGRRVFQATLPASILGEIVDASPPVDGQVLLTLDAVGNPARVEVTTGPDGPPLSLSYDISRLGEPAGIVLPTG